MKSLHAYSISSSGGEAEVDVDYKAFDIGNEFVVGYGLDYAETSRNLPEIGILKRSVYER